MDLKLEILNPDRTSCSDAAFLSIKEKEQPDMICRALDDGHYYIIIEPAENIELLTTGHYGFTVASVQCQRISIDSSDESEKLEVGNFISGEIEPNKGNWYTFKAIKDQPITLIAYTSTHNNLLMTLYDNPPNDDNVITFSDKPGVWRSAVYGKLLETNRGRAMYIASLLRMFGIQPC